MDLGKFIGSFFGGEDSIDPKVNALIDTNHRLTVAHTDMLRNYTDQIVDLKERLAVVEIILKEKFKDAE